MGVSKLKVATPRVPLTLGVLELIFNVASSIISSYCYITLLRTESMLMLTIPMLSNALDGILHHTSRTGGAVTLSTSLS